MCQDFAISKLPIHGSRQVRYTYIQYLPIKIERVCKIPNIGIIINCVEYYR